MIARDKNMKKIIVSNGIIVDKNFMQLDTGETRSPITKHRAYFTLYLFLLPIPKNNAVPIVDLEEAKQHRNDQENVTNN